MGRRRLFISSNDFYLSSLRLARGGGAAPYGRRSSFLAGEGGGGRRGANSYCTNARKSGPRCIIQYSLGRSVNWFNEGCRFILESTEKAMEKKPYKYLGVINRRRTMNLMEKKLSLTGEK